MAVSTSFRIEIGFPIVNAFANGGRHGCQRFVFLLAFQSLIVNAFVSGGRHGCQHLMFVLKLQFLAPPISLTGQSPICKASSASHFANSKAFVKCGGDGLLLFTSFELTLNLKK